MAARLVLEAVDGTEEDFELPRVLYTGTGASYYCSMVRRYGEFRHAGAPYVHLDDEAVSAMGYAAQRARSYEDTPIVLIVDTGKLDADILYTGDYRTRALHIGSFAPYPFTVQHDGRVSEDDIHGVREASARVLRSSEEDLKLEAMKLRLPGSP